MTTARLLVACSMLAACAGGAPVDPGALALRDVLGIAPQVAAAWSPSQRAAATVVIEAGLQANDAAPTRASLASDATDAGIARALGAIDADRARHRAEPVGLVHVATADDGIVVTPRAATILHRRAPVDTIDIQLAGWADDPVLAELATRGSEVLPALAAAAGHTSGPVVVTPAPHLAAVAAYLPASATEPARLVVNPVVLAALEPTSASALLAAVAAFPGPGPGSGSIARPPERGNANPEPGIVRVLQTGCDASDGCDCSDSGDDSSGGGGCDSCSGDSTDSTDSGGSCGGDDSGGDSSCGDCSGGDGGDCSGGGGDCSGGDCSGGGDCNAASRRGPHGRAAVAPSVAWALLPLVFGTIVKRRARRRRADRVSDRTLSS